MGKNGVKHILIVDDEEDLTWGISRSLIRDNCLLEVTCVNSGSEALEIIHSRPVDLLVTDIRMPGLTGLELLEEVHRNHLNIKIIVMTAYGSPEVEAKVVKQGGNYIEKPFEISRLKKMIYCALEEGFSSCCSGSGSVRNFKNMESS
ncbi:hypothetical protein DRQ15_02005 [candidate division KSB1 bacterium]|nr:response regulator [bacterium]RKY86375.1 MAG: hypothetical protein DRP98_00605 [candidate division KSB1 bacterium]RKY89036.1 MAG: hypothetical protein DRQ11_02120 [candidate division KSB1 bacterium]RKY92560.1 MAG: hypothetical protein DRQ15_02005 [candidate division KSB1 bacterium]